jgi:hypothetical protein
MDQKYKLTQLAKNELMIRQKEAIPFSVMYVGVLLHLCLNYMTTCSIPSGTEKKNADPVCMKESAIINY